MIDYIVKKKMINIFQNINYKKNLNRKKKFKIIVMKNLKLTKGQNIQLKRIKYKIPVFTISFILIQYKEKIIEDKQNNYQWKEKII